MGRRRPGVMLLGLAGLLAHGVVAQEPRPRDLVLATTTSVRDAGLLDILLPPFEQSRGWGVKVLAVGSGQAMEIGRRGEADLLILHDPAGEMEFVQEGYGLERRLLMRNEFVVLGPGTDPAGIKGATRAADAFRALAARGSRFVSRGDRSGTHVKEAAVWSAAGVAPRGRWYLEAGQGMGQTLQIANELRAYTLSDLGTFLAHKSPLELEIMVEGDTALANPYHVILVSADRFPWVERTGARALRDYLLDPETQRRIGEFRRAEFGRQLFVPAKTGDAGR
ncbi:MAG TPA: substrate-binding domain-containing protein [Gemmatimonadales bacterium]